MNRSNDFWNGQKDFGKIICIDFDGPIVPFVGWQGPDVFPDKPADGAVETIQRLKKDGWYICIFTTRLVTAKLVQFFRHYDIPFDDINGRCLRFPSGDLHVRLQQYEGETDYSHHAQNFFWGHNPAKASIKPIASVYVDDMSWENEGRPYDKIVWMELYSSVTLRFPNGE